MQTEYLEYQVQNDNFEVREQSFGTLLDELVYIIRKRNLEPELARRLKQFDREVLGIER